MDNQQRFSHGGACLKNEPLQVVLAIWTREMWGREAQKQRSEADIWKICYSVFPPNIGWATCYRNTQESLCSPGSLVLTETKAIGNT